MPELSEGARVSREVFLKSLVPNTRRSFWAASRIAGEMEELTVAAGDVVFRAGEPASDYFFVVSGEVEMTRPGGAPWTIRGPGLVGAIDVTLGRAHRRDALAKTKAEILRLESSVWLDALEDSFDLTLSVVRNMSNNTLALRMRPSPQGGFDPPDETADDVTLKSVVDRVLFMMKVPIFQGATTQALTTLAEATEVVPAEQGVELLAERRTREHLYIVTAGEIEIVHDDTQTTGRFRPGSVVGATAAFTANFGGFRAHATRPSRVLAVALDDYFDVAEEHFSLVRALMRYGSSQVDALIEREAPANLRMQVG